MTYEEFQACVEKHRPDIEEVRECAHMLHESVNQQYDKKHPYGFHLDMVADSVFKYGHLICQSEHDVLPLFFGAFYHDSIEDARMSYNDVTKAARLFMDDEQAYMAAEMVYALTNDKGRTRAERAGERYYQGIRETLYAPFLKLADRLANTTYSFTHCNKENVHMKEVYREEMPHFLEAIDAHSDDPRLGLPQEMIDDIYKLL
jgi:hypothetical protein